MDSSRIGLDFIVENPEYIRKLAAALDTQNVTVKKQVFELLSALCVHNEEGRLRTLDTLEHFMKLKSERYRLNAIVQELDRATVVEYQTALVAFINCLIISTPRLYDRTRIRNEFIGCHLLSVLNKLRKCAEAEPELAVQLDVFDEQRESDDAQSLQGAHGVDLNSPLDVFYAILKQVAETPQETPFLLLLQHLLRIDSKQPISDIIWDTAERLVHLATLLETRDDASRLLRAPSVQSRLFCGCQGQRREDGEKKQGLVGIPTPMSPTSAGVYASAPLGPPLAPPPPPPPTIPPPPPNIPPPLPPVAPSAPQKRVLPATRTASKEIEAAAEKLPQQEIPAPKAKMKTINWNKIPNNKVVGKNNIWNQVACTHQNSPMTDMDWSEMEGLFCQQSPPSTSSSSKPAQDNSENVERRMRKETSEISLLDGKRSLNVNIFLKQFRSSKSDIIQLIRDGEHDEIGTEKLKGLLKILPEVDELDLLKSYNGEFDKLGTAEKFLMHLVNLPNYKLRIQSMLLKEEFAANMGYLEPSINSMIIATQDLMTNKPLHDVLYMIIIAGNFLNSGGYAGNAAGVKLSSLQKITDIRANKPNMNLIHFVALQAQKKNRNLLSFTDNIGVLEDAAKTTVDQLHNEINALDTRIKKIKKHIELPTTETEIKQQMVEFLQMAEQEVASLQRNVGELEHIRRQLAEFFCEDVNSFKLEECFRIFHGFYCKFKQAVAENERRRIQEEQATARRRQREELLASKRKQIVESTIGKLDSDVFSIDMKIYDTKCFSAKKGRKNKNGSEDEASVSSSPSFSRRRLGSFNNGNSGETTNGKDDKSPDITPNGSLRRRRSRVLSEDDEGNLMEFLRASGNDTNRERKSWGSLDRSWARKARGSGPRKRPALLSADFSSDRERPSSPSPLSENKPIQSAPEDEVKTKEWRQKIESWLQTNENDQYNEEQRRQRKLANRKSLEMDSETERTLGTLPEGKQVYTGGQSSFRKIYPAWEPSGTLENTDVVSAMEAVEEVQPRIKDKSAWRKSNLNVSNSTEATQEDDYLGRHTLPRTHHSERGLHSIHENRSTYSNASDRKAYISSLADKMPTDKLTLYIRSPEATNGERKSNLGTTSQRMRDSQQSLDSASMNNKVEIDQDNIETPPTTRKVFIPTPVDKREPLQPSPCSRRLGRFNRDSPTLVSPEEQEEQSVLGDGQFDRYSAARRTRRYKRNQDVHEASSPTENPTLSDPQNSKPLSPIEPPPAILADPKTDRKTRLKAWQDKLINIQDEQESRTSRRYRNQTGVKPGDVELALKLNKEERDEAPQLATFIAPEPIKVTSHKIDIPSRSKTKDDNNDEGFEETQSLMSESPSQGASSGGNYEPDSSIDSAHFVREKPQVVSAVAKRPGDANGSRQTSISKSNSVRNQLLPLPKANIKHSNSLRIASQTGTTNRSVIPRRSSDSLRKVDSKTPTKPTSIQKSNSRNSIVSSRSSLNSVTSTCTVKKLPLKPSSNLNKSIQRTLSNKSVNSGVGRSNLRRASSNSSTISNSRPPRAQQAMSFMKPTASSTTKQSLAAAKSGPQRSKN